MTAYMQAMVMTSIGLRLILVPKVPVENAQNYRVQRPQPADFARLRVHPETAVIHAVIVRETKRKRHSAEVKLSLGC